MNAPKFEKNQIINHLLVALGGSLVVLTGLFYATTNVGHDISPARLIGLLKSSSVTLFSVFVLMTVLGLLFRAWRYQALLLACGEQQIPNFKGMVLVTAIRNMTVDLLPARLGELVFVGLLKRYSNTQISSGISALVFATLLDILMLAPITIAIGLMVGFPNKTPYLLALVALAVVGGFMLGLFFILPFLMSWLRNMSHHENPWLNKLFGFVLSTADAAQSTIRAGVFLKVIGLTVAVRFLKYAGLLCLFWGLTQSSFPQLYELGGLKILGSMIASEMTASLPIPALMSFGTWELGGMTLLAYFGALPQNALLTMLGIHVQTQALDYGFGIAALVMLFLLKGTRSPAKPPGAGRNRLFTSLFVLATMAFSWFGFNSLNNKQAQVSMQVGADIVRPEGAVIPAWIGETKGHIVWSSNRTGNHDIWIMNLPDLKISPLTSHPNTENYARISPDGKKVAFARAHKEWQSFRDTRPWDIWLIDIRTGKERRLAQWGVSPSWSPDGRFVVFQRDPGQLIAVDINSGKERVHYESGNDTFMKSKVNMDTPSIGAGQRLAFSYRNKGRPTNIIRDALGNFQLVHRDACQVQWSPSGDYAIYVQKGGRQKNQFMHFDPITKAKTTLLDLPGEFSHEYFARLTQNEKYMVFAASNGGHEHDIADYELFLWPVGEAPSTATRLTFNSANDSWPDVWLK
ncbi:MAG: Tol biopolymer transport system component [Saprospiraceae bacterium]|jgi:Tol biopolymer transport system component